MTIRNMADQGFDDFRKERKRLQNRLGPQASALGYENHALRELEQAEAQEVRDQQLTREVHDFFAAATRQAAAIVNRVSRDVIQETGAKVEQEMESFLIDSLARMNTFVLTVLHQRRGPVAETHVEPRIGNLVGETLDEFRWAGTAEVGDKHIGQDPFATAVDDVRREFRQQVSAAAVMAGDAAVPIDEHLVATVQGTPAAEPVPTTLAAAMPSPPEPMARTTAAMPPPAPAPAPAPTATAAAADLERFKGALKALVRQGVMSREEATAAWQTRLQTVAAKA